MNDADSNAVGRARALLELGRDAEAADVLRRAVEQHPDDPEALGLLAEAIRATDPHASYEAAQAAVRAAPNDAWTHVIASWSADAARRPSEARALVQAALALDPDSAAAHQAAAQILAKNAATRAQSLASARRLIELAPHDAGAWIAAGNASVHSGLVTEARQYYEYALQLDPNNPSAIGNLAAVEQYRGAHAHAMDLLTAMVRLDPSNAAARRRIDSLAVGLLHELVWLSLPVGFALAVVASLISGAR